MRLPLAVLLAFSLCAMPATAMAQQGRYGTRASGNDYVPSSPADSAPPPRFLDWRGKTPANTATTNAYGARRPEPLAPWAQRAAAQQQQAEAPAALPTNISDAPPAPGPQASARPAGQPWQPRQQTGTPVTLAQVPDLPPSPREQVAAEEQAATDAAMLERARKAEADAATRSLAADDNPAARRSNQTGRR